MQSATLKGTKRALTIPGKLPNCIAYDEAAQRVPAEGGETGVTMRHTFGNRLQHRNIAQHMSATQRTD